ncbi:MAG: hypothetical protein ACREOB_00250 [Thermodesulfobacteriota bacterium]
MSELKFTGRSPILFRPDSSKKEEVKEEIREGMSEREKVRYILTRESKASIALGEAKREITGRELRSGKRITEATHVANIETKELWREWKEAKLEKDILLIQLRQDHHQESDGENDLESS